MPNSTLHLEPFRQAPHARRAISVAVIAASLLAATPAFAQEAKTRPAAEPPAPENYLDLALATGEKTGVRFANANEKAEGPQTIAGSRSYQSPLPFFRDLKPWDTSYRPPRLADGHPDLQGVWSSASLTTMERGENGDKVGDTLVIPPEKIAAITRNSAYSKAAAQSQNRTDPKAGTFTDKNAEAGYNAFWIDPGSEYARVNTEWRSSWITSPANGLVPFSKSGQAQREQRYSNIKAIANTGPEIRPVGDRCLASFGSQAGPPLNNTMYNNNYQIVQTPASLMINVEMNHDVRIINVTDKSSPAARPDVIKPWFGDSIAHWEGDTLVVVTRNLNPTQLQVGAYPVSDEGEVIERFTRASDELIDYRFEVKDPFYYTQNWSGQMPLRRSKERVYEYACHEGNYALPGILRADALGQDTAILSNGE